MTDREWIEQFYADFERGMPGYKRPKDYLKRAKKILKGKRFPVMIPGEKDE